MPKITPTSVTEAPGIGQPLRPVWERIFLALVLVTCGVSNSAEVAPNRPLLPSIDVQATTERFRPVRARQVRMTILRANTATEPCLDEFEIYSSGEATRNVALANAGARASASSCLVGYGQHRVEHLIDGHYGNAHSWVAGAISNVWIQIDLPAPVEIDKIVWGRDRESHFVDRVPVRYRIEAASEPGHWTTIASSEDHEIGVCGRWEEITTLERPYRDLLGPPTAETDSRARAGPQLIIDSWQSDEGLPTSAVSSITQTPDGYLWIGTYDGLARFDGLRFTLYRPDNTPALANGRVLKLHVDRRGRLWILLDAHRLALWEKGQFSAIEVPLHLDRTGLHSLNEDSAGAIELTTASGVFRWNETTRRFVPGEAGEIIYAFHFDTGGHRWAHYLDDRIGTLTNGVLIAATTGAKGEPVAIAAACPRTGGGLWLIDRQAQWRTLSPEGQVSEPLVTPWKREDQPFTFCQDNHGFLWLGTALGDLLRLLADGTVERAASGLDFSRGNLTAVHEDSEGNLWVGTNGGGLKRLKRRGIQVYEPENGATGTPVHSIAATDEDDLWMGTNGSGVFRFRQGVFRPFLPPQPLPWTWATLVDRSGDLWVGTYGDGVFRFHDREQHRYRFWGSSGGGNLLALFEARDGTVWAGGTHGLWRFRGPETVAYGPLDGLSGQDVRALAEDAEGGLWIGTRDGGLNLFKNGVFRNWLASDGLGSDSVWTLYIDTHGILWVGTDGGGLCRFHEGHLTRFDASRGFPERVVCGIAEDANDCLWIGGQHGILRVPRAELEEVAAGKIGRVMATSYSREDGLATRECMGGAAPSVGRTRDGRLWFPTFRGLAAVAPAQLRLNTNPPPTAVEEVTIDEATPLVPRGSVVIPPGRHRVEFRFTALSLTAAGKNRFRYRLEGFDPDWVEAGAQRTATYTRVPPGAYRFRLLAANNDGVWNTAGLALPVVVQAQFWEHRWFQGAAVGGFLAAAGVIVRHVSQRKLRARLQRLREQHALELERARIAQDMHDDVGAQLTRIALLGDLAKRQSATGGKAASHIDEMARTARTAVNSLDEIVWAVSPRHDNVESLANYLSQFADEYLSPSGLACRFSIPRTLPDVAIATEARHNLFLAVKEALNNLVKHAQATEVRLTLALEPDICRVEIEDNGIGFDAAVPGTGGNGLANMRARMESIGGRFEISSRIGSGTKIILAAPLRSK